jgi:hypothetical protein
MNRLGGPLRANAAAADRAALRCTGMNESPERSRAILRVDGGRGLVIEKDGAGFVITAAHCLTVPVTVYGDTASKGRRCHPPMVHQTRKSGLIQVCSAGKSSSQSRSKRLQRRAQCGLWLFGTFPGSTGLSLPVEPNVLEAIAAEDGVDHQRQALNRRLPA